MIYPHEAEGMMKRLLEGKPPLDAEPGSGGPPDVATTTIATTVRVSGNGAAGSR